MDNNSDSRYFAWLMLRPLDDLPRKWQFWIVILSLLLMGYLSLIYDYVKLALEHFGFLGTLPFWFVGNFLVYGFLNLVRNGRDCKIPLLRACCLGVDITVLLGFLFGRMHLHGYLLIAVLMGMSLGPVACILVDLLDERLQSLPKSANLPSMDCFLMATLNRKVVFCSFLLIICVSIMNGIWHRL